MEIKDYQYISFISDLLDMDEIKKLKEFEHHRVTNRLYHSIDVSYKSYLIAKKIGLKPESLREVSRAGLLHDLFYYDTKIEKHKKHLSTHPEIAVKNAEKICDLTDKEKDIIISHMFGVSFKHIPKYKESFIVSMVDKVVSINEVFNRVKKKRKNIYLKFA